MIAACPTCGARYRIESGQLPSGGARLRCPRCRAVFRVRLPAEAPSEPGAATAAAASEPGGGASAEAAAPRGVDRKRLVLVADSEVEAGKATAHALADWGLHPILVHDGVEAILTIQRMLPRAVVLDAALPKMFGFQVCELVKRNESLREIRVVLVGAIYHRERYKRPPGELYGADAYIERPQLPEALRPILRGFGLTVAGQAAPAVREAPPPALPPAPAEFPSQPETSRPMPSPAPEPIPTPVHREPAEERQPERPAAPEGPALDGADAREGVAERSLETAGEWQDLSERTPEAGRVEPRQAEATREDTEVAKAERLARIIVSDVVLYNQEKFEAAIRAGNVLEAMDGEMQEARAHFQQRIHARVRESKDFLSEELLRVARQRGGK